MATCAAVIVVVPEEITVTSPVALFTVATFVLDDVYVKAEALVEVGAVICTELVVATTGDKVNVPYTGVAFNAVNDVVVELDS